MATKKQKRAAALAKREEFPAEVRAAGLEAQRLEGEDLVKVTLVPVEVFGTDCPKCDDGVEHYGLCDAVSSYSDCNRADGQIYRRDDESSVPYRNPDDVITIYVPRSELPKFDKKFGDDYV